MKISVQNLGPIKEGTIDLSKNLTVFCGPNGTGKTFISILTHEYYFLSNGFVGLKITEIEKYKILNEQINKKAKEGGNLEIEVDIQSLESLKNELINLLNRKITLKNIYGLNDFQIDNFTKELKIDIQKEIFLESFFNQEIKEKEIEILSGQYYNIIISKNPFSNFLTIHFPTNYYEIEHLKQYLKNEPYLILLIILSRIFNNLNLNIKFFSVERISFNLMQSFNPKDNFSDNLILPFYLKENYKRMLDYTDFKNKILRNFKSHYYDLVIELEVALIGGSLFYDDMGEIMFKNNRTNQVFPYLHIASSVKSLASFFLYLKHEVRQNETIIIDEPEMNLHPDTQVMFARIIARLINAGLKFIISTHSDFILREFNNLIEVSFNDETKNYAINNLQYKKDEYINTEDINLFYFNFKDNDPKSIITQIPVDEYGFSLESVEIVVDKLNDETYKLYKIINFGLEELLNEENNPNEYKQNIKESSKLVAENGAEFNK